MNINHPRFAGKENRRSIDEKGHICVPGLKIFDSDYLLQWLKGGVKKDINSSLLFHKCPRWFKDYNQQGVLTGVELSYEFQVPDDKSLRGRIADPARDDDYKRVRHDYKREHLDDIVSLSSILPTNYDDLKRRYFFDQKYSFPLETGTRLLVGFAGTETVFENSISLHPLYGFPVIPASSIKGLVLSYCEYKGVDKSKITRIFGEQEVSKEKKASEGEVVFMDAWPEGWHGKPIMEVDIMTPHHKDYYGKNKLSKDSLPKDSDTPVPLSFLAVPRDVEFRFCLLPSRICKDEEGDIVKEAKEYLSSALKNFGVGAKTGSSYGYFKEAK